jgi:hypothetical protein
MLGVQECIKSESSTGLQTMDMVCLQLCNVHFGGPKRLRGLSNQQ